MFIVTDPLSLVFIGCFLFGLLFLVVTTMLGNLSHSGHSTHVGHSDFSHHVEGLHHVPHVVNHQVGALQGKAVLVGNSVPPAPYTMSAWFGPTLRNKRPTVLISSMTTITAVTAPIIAMIGIRLLLLEVFSHN